MEITNSRYQGIERALNGENADVTILFKLTPVGTGIHYETNVTIHLSSACYGGNSKPIRHLIKNAIVIRKKF